VRLAIAVAILMVLLFPVYWLVVSSLESALEIFHSPPSLLPVDPSLSYLGDVLGAQAPHLLTSLIVSVGTVALSLAIAVPAAYALSQLAVRWTGIVVLALLIVQMIPQVVLGIPYYLVFEKLRLLNSYEGLILADSSYSVPFIVIVLRAYLLNIPKELREASLVDGAGELRTLLRVIVPVGAPGIVAGALFAFLFAWNDFFFALTLTNTPNIEPMTLSLYLYVGTELQQWNLAMAAAAFAAVPSVLLVVGAQRYIRGGLTAGSVRG
jgi:multiple sugar transport system permease protein